MLALVSTKQEIRRFIIFYLGELWKYLGETKLPKRSLLVVHTYVPKPILKLMVYFFLLDNHYLPLTIRYHNL